MAHALKSRLWLVTLLSCALPAGAAPPQTAGAQDDPALTRAKEIQALHEADLFRVGGVHAVGLGKNDAGEWVVHVYAGKEVDRRALPEQLNGMKVVVFESDAFVPADTCQVGDQSCPRASNNCQHRRPFAFPVPSGVSTSNDQQCQVGTIGFRVCDAANHNIVGYVTNNHIAARDSSGCPNGPPNTPQFQPGRCDSSCNQAANIGTLERYVPLGPGNHLVDAAFVRSDAQRISGNILDIGQPTGNARDPMPDETVRKSGSTTGFTQGTVESINASVPLNYGCFFAQLVGQIVVTPGSFGAGGDSGSPVVDADNNPVGLLFAVGQTRVSLNPMTTVLDELGVTFDCSAPPPTENNADFLHQAAVPTEMELNQTHPVSLTFRNNGTTTWTSAELYRLGSQSPPNNDYWGFQRFHLPHDVGPGQEVTFSATVTAPDMPAYYDFRWRMVRDGVGEWFGEQSDNVRVRVGGGGQCPPPAPDALSPEGPVDTHAPTFNWTPAPGATTYTLYVQHDDDVGDWILRVTDITSTSYTPAVPLPAGERLRWKVKGECGVSGPYSDIPRFTVLFGDVPANHWARFFIEELYGRPRFVSENMGVNAQGRVVFGAESPLLRQHAARWLLRAKMGPAYVPPDAIGMFSDVPANSEFAPWIEDLYRRGITAGCGPSLYCPDNAVTRGQAAVLWLRMKEGTAYVPPPCVTPTFADVPCSSPFAPWVEEFRRRGITGGCQPGLYCPNNAVSRAEASVFTYGTFY